MTIECDVLVVGAGPAGSVASLVCAKNGLDTILLEKNSVVGGHTKTKLDASADGELSSIIQELKL
ncbi:MAG: FAD-dependent oxidoreductase, partial [Candidatus Hydrothermarchaeales archaeon]